MVTAIMMILLMMEKQLLHVMTINILRWCVKGCQWDGKQCRPRSDFSSKEKSDLGLTLFAQTNRISHRSLMQSEKSQTMGEWIMPKTRFTKFPALTVDRGWEFLRLHLRPMIDIFLTYGIKNY